MKRSVKIFSTPHELAQNIAKEMVALIAESAKNEKRLSVALSGGSTPELLFSILGNQYAKSVLWNYVHFFWADERCVSPEDMQSNYGMTYRNLFEKIVIPSGNIHRIRGEEDPEKEALRYSEEVSTFTNERDGIPLFDLILLGLGEDGHTASIFPGNEELFHTERICEVAIHPVSKQKRITITGQVINNADAVWFVVSGKKKAEVLVKILSKSTHSRNFPATCVVPVYGSLNWFIDNDAGSSL